MCREAHEVELGVGNSIVKTEKNHKALDIFYIYVVS